MTVEHYEEQCFCPDCGAKHAIVRPGKTQPVCDCHLICKKCNGRIKYHSEPDPRWPNFSGDFCENCGPFGEIE